MKVGAMELEKRTELFYFSSTAFPFPAHFSYSTNFKYAVFAPKSLMPPSP